MILCKHAFCYDCANLYEKQNKTRARCVQAIVFLCCRLCSAVQGCKRTCSSQKTYKLMLTTVIREVKDLLPVLHWIKLILLLPHQQLKSHKRS